jgi:hypothetical protein
MPEAAYKFPDEKNADEAEEKLEIEIEGDEKVEIEIVDDTPEKDRNRKPMIEPPSEPSEEELASYSESVRNRFKHFTKGYHEERRAKEAATREKDEAVRIAQAIIEENNQLKGNLTKSQTALLDQAKKNAQVEIEKAKAKYKEAMDSFDSDASIEAQEALREAQNRMEKIQAYRPASLQPTQNIVQPAQQQAPQPVSDPDLLAWQDKNQWFGQDRKMTAYALGLHQELADEGIPVGSEQYYKRIDSEMKERFSDRTGGDAKSQRSKNGVVAPATRSTAPRKIVLTKTSVSLAKRLGIPLDLYARKVAEEMRK